MAAKRRRKKEKKTLVFSALNYKILGVGILLVIIGFTIMRLENEVYGFISLYISPVLIMAGYITVVFAILKRPGTTSNGKTDTAPQKN